MRKGVNPEKTKETRLIHKRHRIIMPFWIPNVDDDYFRHQPEVLQLCLQSLTSTINTSQTNITLINNNSCPEASRIAEQFVAQGLIDKYVVRNENRGKLENVLAEARASFEDYITISDADFLFYDGWENAVARVFNSFKRAGVVSAYPCPNLAFNHNTRWPLSFGWKCGSVAAQHDMNLVDMGLGHPPGQGIYSSLGVKKKYRWAEKQYYLEKNGCTAVFGAVHALATFKRDIFQKLPFRKVEHVFKNGYEEQYLDYFSDRLGYYRLSTIRCNAYHMGNTIPDSDVINHTSSGDNVYTNFPPFSGRNKTVNRLQTTVSSFAVRVLRKLHLI